MSLFDATEVSNTGVEPGEHVATIIDAIVKETKSGDGEYIRVTWQTESGSQFFYMYNIKNPNKKAVDIGLGELKKMMIAGGREPRASGVDELIGIRCLIKTANKEDDYGEKVVIKSYKKAPEAQAF